MAALLVLIVVVLLGSLWARHRSNGGDPDSMRSRGGAVASALAPVTVNRE